MERDAVGLEPEAVGVLKWTVEAKSKDGKFRDTVADFKDFRVGKELPLLEKPFTGDSLEEAIQRAMESWARRS